MAACSTGAGFLEAASAWATAAAMEGCRLETTELVIEDTDAPEPEEMAVLVAPVGRLLVVTVLVAGTRRTVGRGRAGAGRGAEREARARSMAGCSWLSTSPNS
jgi:hypothetical protein